MATLSDALLARIMPNASEARRAACLDPINVTMQRYGVLSLARAAAFLAQIAHESGELQFMHELWGPTAQQKRYDPPSDLARRLGNTQPGDGRRYRGRGPIQITGRANYRRYGRLLDLDLEPHPERAADPPVGFLIAGEYWVRNGLNELADSGDFDTITRRINGGMNGADERRRLYQLALDVLAGVFPAGKPAAAAATPKRAGAKRRSGTRRRATPPLRPRATRTLARGDEAIRLDAVRAVRAARAEAAKAGKRTRRSTSTASTGESPPRRVLDARPDTLDFRDRMYEATLVEVPPHVPLGDYLALGVPVLDQGSEGACTGFGLATVANYLLRRRRILPDTAPVSPRMLYDLARRYDEWPGQNYSGSSARGAMKGWYKHGVCSETLYPYGRRDRGGMTDARAADAQRRPLGSYFRVNHKDVVAMHAALAEVGVLYATSSVHDGWSRVGRDGVIEQSPNLVGGHAFALVSYDDQGFWLQNSWGEQWGRGGFGRISYDDWLANGTDVWVARLGAPITLHRLESAATAHSTAATQSSNAYSYADLRPHIVSVGNDGQLKSGGDYGSTPQDLEHIFTDDMPRIMSGWPRPRVLLYAHGGLVDERTAVQHVADYRPPLLKGQVYPLAFIWRTDFWSTVKDILQDAASRRRPEGVLGAAKDFMLDRLDDALEPLARTLGGKLMWDQMKQNALAISERKGAGVLVADQLKALAARTPGLEVHLVGHSAGSIVLAPLIELLAARGLKVATCTLWAPACTVELFRKHYLPAMKSRGIGAFAMFHLSDKAERDDNCEHVYNKSLLYLVSDAFEAKERIPLFRDGVPLLGMERWLDPALRQDITQAGGELISAPNTFPDGSPRASRSTSHGGFDDDRQTVEATFSRVTGAGSSPSGKAKPSGVGSDLTFHRSASALRTRRTQAMRSPG